MTGALFGLVFKRAVLLSLMLAHKKLQDKLITQLHFFAAITKWNTTLRTLMLYLLFLPGNTVSKFDMLCQ